MQMVALALQPVSMTPGVTQTPVTPDASPTENTVPAGDRNRLEFENTNASTRTVVILVPASAGLDQYGQTFSDLSYTLGATTGRLKIGPLDPRFVQSDGFIHFTVSANAGVTCMATSQ